MSEWVQLLQLAVPVALAALFLRELADGTGHRLFEMSRELVRRAQIDGMTGLLNRSTWEAQAIAQLEYAQKAGRPATLLLLDLDEFKVINDTHRHAAGDAALVAFAQTLSSMAGPRDIVGRLGGDEFVILLPEKDFVSGMRMRDAILAGLRDSGNGMIASIGIVITEPGETLEHLMIRADRHMFQQKHRSRAAAGQTTGERVAMSAQA
ncbi:MAG: GGDEF domain-containing protein [Thermomicrobiales bacterium]